MAPLHGLIERRRAAIGDLCRRYRVRRLDVFGSGARAEDFDPGRSDVDFLVEFDPADSELTLTTFFALRDALAAVLERPVDLVMASGIENPYVKAELERARESVYAA